VDEAWDIVLSASTPKPQTPTLQSSRPCLGIKHFISCPLFELVGRLWTGRCCVPVFCFGLIEPTMCPFMLTECFFRKLMLGGGTASGLLRQAAALARSLSRQSCAATTCLRVATVQLHCLMQGPGKPGVAPPPRANNARVLLLLDQTLSQILPEYFVAAVWRKEDSATWLLWGSSGIRGRMVMH